MTASAYSLLGLTTSSSRRQRDAERIQLEEVLSGFAESAIRFPSGSHHLHSQLAPFPPHRRIS
jgi:hypothetical protein